MKPANNSTGAAPTTVSLTQFVGYFLRLGTIGFGGPIALADYTLLNNVSPDQLLNSLDLLIEKLNFRP